MKRYILILVATVLVGMLAAAPVVTYVLAAQSDSKVMIFYHLSHPYNLPCEVELQISNDGGESFSILPSALEGDFGTIAATAEGDYYEITWFFTQEEFVIEHGSNYCVKLLADDGAGQVAQPVILPPGGTYDSSQNISISCDTPDATIHYTIDGTEPSEDSPAYADSIMITSSTMLKAKGFKTGWTPSATASETYIIIPENFVFVQGGTIYPAEGNYTDSLTVTDFYIDKYELTQDEYEAVMGSNPSYFDGNPNHPVEKVTWFDAIEYCNRRSIQEFLPPCYSYLDYGSNPDNWPAGWNSNDENHDNISCDWNATGYRLPSEAEWEYAARGGLQTHDYSYSGSNNIDDVAWYDDNSEWTTHEVGSKLPNELGIYDMSGNVWEWCWDVYSGAHRVVRGGSWNLSAYYCAVSYRSSYSATYSFSYLGFRICRNIP